MPEADVPKPSIDVKKPSTTSSSRNIYCGLVWPEKGFPAYFCAVGRKIDDKTKSFDDPKAKLQIFQEGEAATFTILTEKLADLPKPYCKNVYALLEPRFHSFVWDFSRWKRESGADLSLRATKSSNFEASLLKIKELVKEGRLIFPSGSLIRSQLSMFSRANLSDEVEFYAVRALSLVIGAFDIKRGDGTVETVPKLRAWW